MRGTQSRSWRFMEVIIIVWHVSHIKYCCRIGRFVTNIKSKLIMHSFHYLHSKNHFLISRCFLLFSIEHMYKINFSENISWIKFIFHHFSCCKQKSWYFDVRIINALINKFLISHAIWKTIIIKNTK